MRPTPWLLAEPHRFQHPLAAAPYGSGWGAFRIPGPCNVTLQLIVSAAFPEESVFWEHVSVSTKNRCPNWPEMQFIKEIFWDDEEAVMQLHPPKSDYVNCHPYCLHLWRPVDQAIPRPPSIMVGPATLKVAP